MALSTMILIGALVLENVALVFLVLANFRLQRQLAEAALREQSMRPVVGGGVRLP